MMSTVQITKVEKQKKNHSRYSLYLNERFAFGVYEDTLIKFSLFKGSFLEQECIEEIKRFDEMIGAYQTAVKFLTHQLRSEQEVRQRLLKENYSDQMIHEVVLKLHQQGFLDDDIYADAYVQTTKTVRKKGVHALKKELKQKGIEELVAEKAVASYSFEEQRENAADLMQKYIKRQSHTSVKMLQQKSYHFLLQKGYPSSVINTVIQEYDFRGMEDEEMESIEHHASKILKRLEKKYSGKELQFKLKTALFQKGFMQESIEQWCITRDWEN